MTSNIPEAVRRLSPISEATRGFAPVPEAVWERVRENQVRRERGRLIRQGLLSVVSRPIVMVKDQVTGAWKLPSLKQR
jgi:hypothetical protein